MFKSIFAVITLIAIGSTTAQAAPAGAPATKQELAQRVVQLWHVEDIGQSMLQAPVAESVQQARVMLQGLASPERREPAMKDVTEEAKKFMDETSPLVRTTAQKLIPTTVLPILTERFTEEELRQIVAILESPVKRKFEEMVPEMQKALGEKLASDARPVIEPKLQDLKQRIGLRLRAAVTP
ncbi:hypothetical protein [Noviherbaspirillum massiliense]|uniref:hypothetical protein n=1 Tax=Noviherbaspirillum massiliense TaxID=1465823 RepID=UPI00031B8745|nr:hypothetical protein [Noviherbaspirillum massiliense]